MCSILNCKQNTFKWIETYFQRTKLIILNDAWFLDLQGPCQVPYNTTTQYNMILYITQQGRTELVKYCLRCKKNARYYPLIYTMAPFQYRDCIYRHCIPLIKDKTVSRPFYLYNRNHILVRRRLYIETFPIYFTLSMSFQEIQWVIIQGPLLFAVSPWIILSTIVLGSPEARHDLGLQLPTCNE